MANPHKGEVALDVEGTSYTLKLSYNALCDAEQAFGKKATDILAEASQGSWTAMRVLFFVALKGVHPEVTLAQAGDMIGTLGLAKVLDVLSEVTTLAFNPGGTAATENPPTQQ